jgi:hypothetical protein
VIAVEIIKTTENSIFDSISLSSRSGWNLRQKKTTIRVPKIGGPKTAFFPFKLTSWHEVSMLIVKLTFCSF